MQHLGSTQSTLGADGRAAAGDLLPAVPHSAGHETRVTETARRHCPGHIPDIARNIGLVPLLGRRDNDGQFVYQRGVHTGLGGNRTRVCHLPGIQLDPPDLLERTHHQRSHRIVGQTLVIAGHQLVVHGSASPHRSALGGLQSTREYVLHRLAGRAAEEVFHARPVGYYVGGLAALRYDVVDAGGLRDVLAHHVHHVIEGLHCIEGGAACFGCAGCVGRFSAEGEEYLHVGEAGCLVDCVAGVGMPVEHGVESVEHSFAHHVRLASSAFFRRAAEEFDCAGNAVRRHPFGCGYRTGYRARAQQIMSAGMSGRTFHQRLLEGNRILAHPCNSVVFRHHSYHRAAAAETGDEGGGYAGRTPLHAESLALQE